MMNGDYSVKKSRGYFSPAIKYDLTFSARRVGKPLVFKHEHRFGLDTKSKRGLWPSDILSFPLRICPHHTTCSSIGKDTHKRTWPYRPFYNGPLLTHAINSAFPAHKRYQTWFWFLRPKFREPTMTEENQMNEPHREGDLWWCRSCPTKLIVWLEEDELVVTVWQSFGTTEEGARWAWSALVRREGNSEFGSESRVFPLFRARHTFD